MTMNEPKTIAYVVRVSEIEPTENTLWDGFEVDSWRTYVDVAGSDMRQMVQAWREDLEKSAGLKWLRDPVRPRGG